MGFSRGKGTWDPSAATVGCFSEGADGWQEQRVFQTAMLRLLHHCEYSAFFLVVLLRDLRPSGGFFWI